jgi:thymidylate synthase
MKQYQQILSEIINNGVEKPSARENLPNTIGLSNAIIKMDLQEGFPLLTTKKMYWKGIVHELLWFLRGDTNIKYLVDNGCNIWNQDAYRWYLKFAEDNGGIEQNSILKNNGDNTLSMYSYDEFIDKIKSSSELPTYIFTENYVKKHKGITSYTLGDLGKVYGHQWRNQNGVDQVRDVVEGLKRDPFSRYHIIDGWNKADFVEMALPPCHLLYQFVVRPISTFNRLLILEKRYGSAVEPDNQNDEYCDSWGIPKFCLDLNMYQRSCDTFLGVPFNLASMSLLLTILAKASEMIPGVATWIGGDTHLYVDHLPLAKEQISREPMKLPKMNINKDLKSLDDILNLTIDDFELVDYNCHPAIKAELFAGLKK